MKAAFLLTACAALAACGGNASDSKSEAAQPNARASMPMDGGNMAADPSNPYAASEMEMHERMMVATGADPSEGWTRKMIEHHRGALAMSEALLALPNPDPEVATLARRTIETQGREIEELNALLRRKGQPPQPAPAG